MTTSRPKAPSEQAAAFAAARIDEVERLAYVLAGSPSRDRWQGIRPMLDGLLLDVLTVGYAEQERRKKLAARAKTPTEAEIAYVTRYLPRGGTSKFMEWFRREYPRPDPPPRFLTAKNVLRVQWTALARQLHDLPDGDPRSSEIEAEQRRLAPILAVSKRGARRLSELEARVLRYLSRVEAQERRERWRQRHQQRLQRAADSELASRSDS